MSILYKIGNTVMLRRLPAWTLPACRQYTDKSASPTATEDLNSVIWAGIVVKKYRYTGITAIVQNHTGLKVPVKSKDNDVKDKLHNLKLGMNVLVKGSLDQEKIVHQLENGYKRIGQNYIDASEIDIVAPEEVEQRKEERSERVMLNFTRSDWS